MVLGKPGPRPHFIESGSKPGPRPAARERRLQYAGGEHSIERTNVNAQIEICIGFALRVYFQDMRGRREDVKLWGGFLESALPNGSLPQNQLFRVYAFERDRTNCWMAFPCASSSD